MTGRQLRAARALVSWSAQQLAEASKVGIATIRRAEATDGLPNLTVANLLTLQRALEAADVVFIPENGGGGAGVRMRRPETATPLPEAQ